MERYGLSEKTVARIRELLAQFPEIKRAVLFGSRAKGTYRKGSDVDLALEGEEVNWRLLGRIEMALDDLMLPYTFSLIELSDATNAEVLEHVRRIGKIFYEPVTSPSPEN